MPARDRGVTADGRVRRGEQGRLRRLRGYDPARRGDLHRRGVPGRPWARAHRGHADGNRRTPAARRPRPRRPTDYGRRRAHEVPCEGGERGREARRPARWCRPAPSSRSSILCPSSGSGASGRSRPGSCTSAGSRPLVASPSSRRKRSSRSLAARAGGTSTRSPTTAIPDRVRERPRRRSIGSQHALGRRERSLGEIDTILVAIVDRVTRRLRKANRVGRTVVLRLRYGDFSRATRSHTLDRPTAHTATILATARGLLAAAQPAIERRGLTLVGLAIANLDDDTAIQLVLPFERVDGRRARRSSRRGQVALRLVRRHPSRAPWTRRATVRADAPGLRWSSVSA